MVSGPWTSRLLANMLLKLEGAPCAAKIGTAFCTALHDGSIDTDLASFVHSVMEELGGTEALCCPREARLHPECLTFLTPMHSAQLRAVIVQTRLK